MPLPVAHVSDVRAHFLLQTVTYIVAKHILGHEVTVIASLDDLVRADPQAIVVVEYDGEHERVRKCDLSGFQLHHAHAMTKFGIEGQ